MRIARFLQGDAYRYGVVDGDAIRLIEGATTPTEAVAGATAGSAQEPIPLADVALDGTSPIGPWIVTRDEFGEVGFQAIRCRVNGETMQSATLADLHFGVPRIIAELSRGLTLLPGDVILTGTPSGVGFARTPPRYLRPGDVVESEIEGIGTLRNEVR